ncbi:MAG: hypothetical protein ACRDKS_04870, partial [Actinomycetota bacterium]
SQVPASHPARQQVSHHAQRRVLQQLGPDLDVACHGELRQRLPEEGEQLLGRERPAGQERGGP